MSISHWGIHPGMWMRYYLNTKPRFWQPCEFNILLENQELGFGIKTSGKGNSLEAWIN